MMLLRTSVGPINSSAEAKRIYIRPIACGVVYRRLVSRLAMQSIKDDSDLHDYLEPTQLSVGTSGGIEAVIHAIRHSLSSLRSSEKYVLLSIDFSNGFNRYSRQAFLDGCQNTYSRPCTQYTLHLPWKYTAAYQTSNILESRGYSTGRSSWHAALSTGSSTTCASISNALLNRLLTYGWPMTEIS